MPTGWVVPWSHLVSYHFPSFGFPGNKTWRSRNENKNSEPKRVDFEPHLRTCDYHSSSQITTWFSCETFFRKREKSQKDWGGKKRCDLDSEVKRRVNTFMHPNTRSSNSRLVFVLPFSFSLRFLPQEMQRIISSNSLMTRRNFADLLHGRRRRTREHFGERKKGQIRGSRCFYYNYITWPATDSCSKLYDKARRRKKE